MRAQVRRCIHAQAAGAMIGGCIKGIVEPAVRGSSKRCWGGASSDAEGGVFLGLVVLNLMAPDAYPGALPERGCSAPPPFNRIERAADLGDPSPVLLRALDFLARPLALDVGAVATQHRICILVLSLSPCADLMYGLST